MGDLFTDLEIYADEVYTKRDLKAGIKLVGELIGLLSIGGFALTVLTSWMPAIGIPVSAVTIRGVLYNLAKYYPEMSTEERKELRAFVRWLKSGFNLGGKLIG